MRVSFVGEDAALPFASVKARATASFGIPCGSVVRVNGGVVSTLITATLGATRRMAALMSASFGCPFEGEVPVTRVVNVARRLADAGVEVAKTEYLRTFDGQPGFSLAQGE